MRKRLTLAVAMAVGVAVVVVAACRSRAVAGADRARRQHPEHRGQRSRPQKLSKKTAEPVTLDVTTATTTTNPAANKGAPIPAVEAIVDFPKGAKIFSKGYPTCDAGLLQNTSTEAALEACKKAQIGSGEGTARPGGRRKDLPGDDGDHGLQRHPGRRQAGDPPPHLQPVTDPDDPGARRRGEQPQQGRLRAAPRRRRSR